MYLFENTMKKEYKSDDFICPKSRIEKMEKKNQVKAKANINIYKTEIMKKQQNMKGITIFYFLVRQSSGSPQTVSKSVIIVIYCAAFETKRGFSLV